MGLLDGKVILVTGAAQEGSIGDAIARRVAEEGATAVVTSRRAPDAEAAVARLKAARLRAAPLALDVGSDAGVASAARSLLAAHGRVDGVVHNAGFPVTEWSRSFLDVPPDEYGRVFNVDVVGALRLTRALLPAMMDAGSGSLVFTSSTAALGGYRFLHEFAPAKAGVVGIMKGLALEFGARGVRANAVAYGNIRTPATFDALTPELQTALADEAALRRWGEPREAAGACAFLLSDLASFVNGQTLVVDGGALLR